MTPKSPVIEPPNLHQGLKYGSYVLPTFSLQSHNEYIPILFTKTGEASLNSKYFADTLRRGKQIPTLRSYITLDASNKANR
mmetsp:Transcript_26158/g.30134  ORF Transcript_26158/g.30134 Transcript_26158/m.30134 type:complete len:81 (+) Transcript_26158:579-821(+)